MLPFAVDMAELMVNVGPQTVWASVPSYKTHAVHVPGAWLVKSKLPVICVAVVVPVTIPKMGL